MYISVVLLPAFIGIIYTHLYFLQIFIELVSLVSWFDLESAKKHISELVGKESSRRINFRVDSLQGVWHFLSQLRGPVKRKSKLPCFECTSFKTTMRPGKAEQHEWNSYKICCYAMIFPLEWSCWKYLCHFNGCKVDFDRICQYFVTFTIMK